MLPSSLCRPPSPPSSPPHNTFFSPPSVSSTPPHGIRDTHKHAWSNAAALDGPLEAADVVQEVGFCGFWVPLPPSSYFYPPDRHHHPPVTPLAYPRAIREGCKGVLSVVVPLDGPLKAAGVELEVIFRAFLVICPIFTADRQQYAPASSSGLPISNGQRRKDVLDVAVPLDGPLEAAGVVLGLAFHE